MSTSKLLNKIKQEYNQYLKRNEKAEEYFRTKTVSECIEHLELFNEITIKLSLLQTAYEKLTGKQMTKEEKLQGFT